MGGAGENKGRGLGWGSSCKPHNAEKEPGECFVKSHQLYVTGSIPGAETQKLHTIGTYGIRA